MEKSVKMTSKKILDILIPPMKEKEVRGLNPLVLAYIGMLSLSYLLENT